MEGQEAFLKRKAYMLNRLVEIGRIGVCWQAERQAILNGPQLRRDYPPNLSISLSGGKDTNRDSLSNGE